ncbi:FecR family protein [Chitinophaga sp. sic0106]|uniref:FecR family protein n=1 Tax=Chitinophaga sp. sic0106 TaxID=2854785 RepID=UPI001C44479F|nr:FecR family protein [Chitinophaga sp. sic0106]MBV7533730.1 FecR domain-containing protein [Chitinophaga sp. sic0106]
MEQQQVFKQLLDKYLAGTISAGEKKHLEAMLASDQYRDYLESHIDHDWEQLPATPDKTDPVGEAIFSRIQEHNATTVPVSSRRIWAAAAVAAILITGVGLYITLKPSPAKQLVAANKPTDVGPGGDKAILTLANGQKVVLDSGRQGVILSQAGITVQKNGTGQIVYEVSGNNEAPVEYNTITTPPGGQFQVVLPDGSRVWLNSCSSLHFPTSFKAKQRSVDLKGEGYFEIAANEHQPFNVTVNEINIQVLGTRFNVMAYADEEDIRTTLLQGAVKLWSNNQPLVLKPGEEGRFNRKQATMTTVAGNEEEALAWKNGYFSFEHADLKSIIRQLGRWYDLEIIYEGALPEARFMGMISRNGPLSGAMNVLKGMGVNSRLEGKTLVIMPVN